MRLELSFAIAVVVTSLILCSTIVVLALMLARQMRTQATQIQSLTNLATSKDLATFANLQALSSEHEIQKQSLNPATVEPMALDDASMAEYIATRYAEHGIDPKQAYAQDDDPLNDFGGAEAFR